MTQIKPLVPLHGELKTPPMSHNARVRAGFFLRFVQLGEMIEFPNSRPMPSVGNGCHELRLSDTAGEWRVIYAIEDEAILILDVFQKKTNKTPKATIDNCKRRLARYRAEEGKE